MQRQDGKCPVASSDIERLRDTVDIGNDIVMREQNALTH